MARMYFSLLAPLSESENGRGNSFFRYSPSDFPFRAAAAAAPPSLAPSPPLPQTISLSSHRCVATLPFDDVMDRESILCAHYRSHSLTPLLLLLLLFTRAAFNEGTSECSTGDTRTKDNNGAVAAAATAAYSLFSCVVLYPRTMQRK